METYHCIIMKIYHQIILFLVMLVVTLPVSAQLSVGLGGGYAYNYYNYDPQYMSGMDYKGHHGITNGLSVDYQFNDWLGLSTGFSFQQKGFVLNGSYIPEGSEEPYVFYSGFQRNDSYFVVPIMAEFSFGSENWEGFMNLGGYAGWWRSSIYEFEEIRTIMMHNNHIMWDISYNGKATRGFNNDVDQRLEFGGVVGLGLKWNLFKSVSLFSDARAFIAFTPQQKDYQIMHFPSHNTTIIVQIGLLYHFK